MQELIDAITVKTTHLRQDSCRGCGFEIEPFRFCSFCNQPLQFRCRNCDKDTEEQIHVHNKFGVNMAIKL